MPAHKCYSVLLLCNTTNMAWTWCVNITSWIASFSGFTFHSSYPAQHLDLILTNCGFVYNFPLISSWKMVLRVCAKYSWYYLSKAKPMNTWTQKLNKIPNEIFCMLEVILYGSSLTNRIWSGFFHKWMKGTGASFLLVLVSFITHFLRVLSISSEKVLCFCKRNSFENGT